MTVLGTKRPIAPLSALAVIRPPNPSAAGEAAVALARAGASFLLVLDPLPESALAPLESAAAHSNCAVVAIDEGSDRALAHASSLTLGSERICWVWERKLLVGLRATPRKRPRTTLPDLRDSGALDASHLPLAQLPDGRLPASPRSVRPRSIPSRIAPVSNDHIVYACPDCETRYLGVQRCNRFCRRLGVGGSCPGCDDILTLEELLAH